MATALSEPKLLTADDFFRIEWDSDVKAELSNGVIRMMSGGSVAHSRVAGNVFRTLAVALRGSGCRPHGPDMAVIAHDLSVRYPDVSVWYGKDGPEHDKAQGLRDPKIVVEVLSPTTRDQDLRVKLPEYRAIASLDTILYVDPVGETIQQLQRTGPASWNDADLGPDQDVALPQFDIVLTRAEIFARD